MSTPSIPPSDTPTFEPLCDLCGDEPASLDSPLNPDDQFCADCYDRVADAVTTLRMLGAVRVQVGNRLLDLVRVETDAAEARSDEPSDG